MLVTASFFAAFPQDETTEITTETTAVIAAWVNTLDVFIFGCKIRPKYQTAVNEVCLLAEKVGT
jgi:hypothetical protein